MQDRTITQLSQSMDSCMATMESRISALEQRQEEINTVISYLAMANLEFSQDMSTIYKALHGVAASMDDDPLYPLGGFSDDDSDDDLLN